MPLGSFEMFHTGPLNGEVAAKQPSERHWRLWKRSCLEARQKQTKQTNKKLQPPPSSHINHDCLEWQRRDRWRRPAISKRLVLAPHPQQINEIDVDTWYLPGSLAASEERELEGGLRLRGVTDRGGKPQSGEIRRALRGSISISGDWFQQFTQCSETSPRRSWH